MQRKKNILICGNPNNVIRMMIEHLMKDYNIYFISYSKKSQFKKIKQLLGKNMYLNNNKYFHNIFVWLFFCVKICKRKKIDIFIAYTDNPIPNGLCMLLLEWFFPKIQRIFFPYDVVQYALIKEYKYKLKNRLFYFFDKICYEHCQKIITKGFANDLDYLGGIYKIKDKPHFVFNTLIETKDIVYKDNTKLNKEKIHLVYIGGIENSEYSMSNYQAFKDLLINDNIILHIYSDRSYLIEDLDKKHDNLIIHNYIYNHEELLHKISDYDFGVAIHKPSKYDFLQSKMASGMKVYDYLAAGLPIIVDSEHQNLSEMIINNDFGISIPSFKIREIFSYIKKNDYNNLVSSVQNKREKYYLNKHNFNKFCEWINK